MFKDTKFSAAHVSCKINVKETTAIEESSEFISNANELEEHLQNENFEQVSTSENNIRPTTDDNIKTLSSNVESNRNITLELKQQINDLRSRLTKVGVYYILIGF